MMDILSNLPNFSSPIPSWKTSGIMDNFTLATTEAVIEEKRSTWEVIFWCALIISIGLLSVTGNAAVITAVYLYEELRDQVSNIIVVSLALTDISCPFFVMIPTIIALIADGWMFSYTWCLLYCLFNYSLLVVSLFNITLICIDRMEAVVNSLHYNTRVTRPRVLVGVTVVWIFPWLWYSIPLFYDDWITFDYWECNCGIDWGKPEVQWWVYSCFVCLFIPPFLTIIISSAIIMKSAEKSNKNLQLPSQGVTTVECNGQTDPKDQKAKEKASSNEKLFKSLMVLILTFNMCMTPFVVFRVTKMALGDAADVFPRWMSTLSTVCLFVASATNPFIYAIFRKDFRYAFRKLFRSISSKIYPYSA